MAKALARDARCDALTDDHRNGPAKMLMNNDSWSEDYNDDLMNFLWTFDEHAAKFQKLSTFILRSSAEFLEEICSIQYKE